MTTYNPAQRCMTCGSELHRACGLGDHHTADDLELERVTAERDALAADNARLKAALANVAQNLALGNDEAAATIAREALGAK